VENVDGILEIFQSQFLVYLLHFEENGLDDTQYLWRYGVDIDFLRGNNTILV